MNTHLGARLQFGEEGREQLTSMAAESISRQGGDMHRGSSVKGGEISKPSRIFSLLKKLSLGLRNGRRGFKS